MRIAIIGKRAPFCGIVTYSRELEAAMRARGHEVAFFYLDLPGHRADAAGALPSWWRTTLFTVPRPMALRRLQAELAAFQPDLVHASMALGPLDWTLPGFCEALRCPLITTFHVALDHRPTFHNRLSELAYRLYAPTLARCARVIVFGEDQRARLVALGVPPGVLRVLPNGVDVGRYRPGPSAFKAAIGARRLITFMGRMDPEKNVGALLAAFGALDLPGVHLALMGDGVLGARLCARAARMPRTHWLGVVSDEARRIDVLRGSDLFVLPSSIEGLSLALLEAMACGAVALATDVGADGDVVAGVGGVLDPRRLRAQLGPAMRELLAEPGRLETLRAASRQRIRERYNLGRNMVALEAMYAEVAGPRQAGRSRMIQSRRPVPPRS